MKKLFRRLSLVLLAALALAQFWRPARNQSTAAGPNDINLRHPVPAKVLTVLQQACYDCHSNNTRYPWYAEVQPVRWWLDSHIKDGQRHLNFSEFGAYSAKRAASKLGDIADEVEHHTMPLKSYTWLHAEARLSPDEIKLVAGWAEDLQEEITPR